MITVIEKFYKGFENLDAQTMIECYHEEIQFEDPAFGILKGEKAKNMWRMLCESQKGKDFKIKASNIDFSEPKGNAHWEAFYVFSKTGKKVHNVIEAEFEFFEGKIIKHVDRFDLHKWAKQAFGFKGFLLGGTSFFKKKLNEQTDKLLSEFEKKKKENSF